MRFARIVFLIAGVWGLVVLLPLYFVYDTMGRLYPPPLTHPEMFYGFLAVTLAWQVAFLVIARDPGRFRPMMVPAMIEKFLYVATLLVLYGQGRLDAAQLAWSATDLTLGVLFVAAFVRSAAGPSPRP